MHATECFCSRLLGISKNPGSLWSGFVLVLAGRRPLLVQEHCYNPSALRQRVRSGKVLRIKTWTMKHLGGGGRVVCVSKYPFAVPDIKLSKKQETSCFRDLRLHAQAPARRAVLASLRKGSKVAPFSLVALRLRPELWVPPAPGYQRCGSLGFGWVWHRVLLLSGTKLLPTSGGWRGARRGGRGSSTSAHWPEPASVFPGPAHDLRLPNQLSLCLRAWQLC